ncbi:AAA family ATPase [Shigella flexneri]
MELRLKNVTSYKKDAFTILNLEKRVNILYGQNGCGKSTISNYFYDSTHTDYNECECTLLDNYKPLVYNTKFIEDNFYNAQEQKGVFTLSKENADIEKQLIEKEAIKQQLTEQYRQKKGVLLKLEAEMEKKENEYIESIWKKTEPIRNSVLKTLMKGKVGYKRPFFEMIKSSSPITFINLNDIAKEYSILLENRNNETALITPLHPYIPSIDDVNTLATPIIDTSNSYLSETINKLHNLDWVKKGKEHYLDGSTCPFCQEKTISHEFLNALKSIFDESYSKKVKQLSDIKSVYEKNTIYHFNEIQNNISSCALINEKDKENIISNIKILQNIAEKNLINIIDKINNPSTCVTLEIDKELENHVQESIGAVNKKIRDINDKVKKLKEYENKIGKQVWGALHAFCSDDLENLSKHKEKFFDIKKKVHDELNNIEQQGKENNLTIKALRDKISNIDSTIDSINTHLKNLGISGFCIEKHAERKDMYIISRLGHTKNQNVYRSLSEGEKTLITFLYFLECCKGKTDKNDTDSRDIFIVIDDPISSLSQNYVYDIASIIHHHIIKNELTKKVLILTHNLYFFHELIKLSPKSREDKLFKKNYYLGRVTKNDFSIITEIQKNSIQNEYQSLWQILKDAKDGKANKIIIPNIMRNILEYYFAFVHRTDALQDELTKLARDDSNSDFKAFYRYINRGSHSDAVNITDMGDIDPDKYLKQLRTIFSATGDEMHYLKMMDELEEENVTA